MFEHMNAPVDNLELREIILKLQDRLSDYDRQRLHFFLGDVVPRPIRDDLTLSGTLRLMEHLLDQNKINGNDVSFLINALHAIQCSDAVKILNGISICSSDIFSELLHLEHVKRAHATGKEQQTSRTSNAIPSLIDEVILDQQDKSSAEALLELNHATNANGRVMDSAGTNFNPLTITIDSKRLVSSRLKRSHLLFSVSSTTSKCLLLFVVLLLIALAVTGVLLTAKIWAATASPRPIRTSSNVRREGPKENNQTLRSQGLVNLQESRLESNDRNIKAGEPFGSAIGDYFDDSSLPSFDCHYLTGVTIRGSDESMDSYQFFYSPPNHRQSSFDSPIYGNRRSIIRTKFHFDEDEKIDRVEGHLINETMLLPNGTARTVLRVAGLQFHSIKDRASPSYEGRPGRRFTEQFQGYTLGYVTGRSIQCLHQIQFFWYRTGGTC